MPNNKAPFQLLIDHVSGLCVSYMEHVPNSKRSTIDLSATYIDLELAQNTH